jgi:hypothetical protein
MQISSGYSRSFKILIEGVNCYYLLIKPKKEKYLSLFVISSGRFLVSQGTELEIDEEVKMFSLYNSENKKQNKLIPYNDFWELKSINSLELQ